MTQPSVHSVDRVVVTIPTIAEAEKFYTAFGMNVKKNGDHIDLYTHGHPHCWMSVTANGKPKQLQYIRFGIYEQDVASFEVVVAKSGLACKPHPMALAQGSEKGIWLKTPDGTVLQLVVAEKVSPTQKSPKATPRGAARPPASAHMRSKQTSVHPRWLSHVLLFSPDVSGMVTFCEDVLGLKLSDRSVDIVAFMHTPHGSDHHLFAFVKSDGPGLHHTSWDVGSLDDVGEGSEQLRTAGYPDGWGVGRHVLGSNYFYYARDPWGSFAEYSFDIDYVAKGKDWVSGDYPPEDSFYLWGPAVPEWFTVNTETAKAA